jgi:hypothetical protein
MCTGLEIAALISAVGGTASALGVGKGKKVEPEPLMPPGMSEEDYKRIFGKFEEKAGQQYVAPINDLMKFAYSIPLQYYGGMSPQDISIPGITPFGGGGMGSGMPGNIGRGGAPGGGAAPWMQRGGGAPGGGSAAPWMSRGGGRPGQPAQKPRQRV